MDINVQKLQKGVAIAVCIAIVGYSLYLAYGVFFNGPVAQEGGGLANINPGLYGPKIQKAAAPLVDANAKISFKSKDVAFTKTPLFQSFTDLPVEIPLSATRGRPDPFVPYAAP